MKGIFEEVCEVFVLRAVSQCSETIQDSSTKTEFALVLIHKG
jgi:hypothetical protein